MTHNNSFQPTAKKLRFYRRPNSALRRLQFLYVASLSVTRSEHRACFGSAAWPSVPCYGQLGFLAYFFVGFGLLLARPVFPVCHQRYRLEAFRLRHSFPGKLF